MNRVIQFSAVEASVLVDIFEWSRRVDDIEEHIFSTQYSNELFNLSVSDDVIKQLRDENTLETTNVGPDELEPLLEAFANELQDRAWDLENTQATFEFYESTFASIEETVEQQARKR